VKLIVGEEGADFVVIVMGRNYYSSFSFVCLCNQSIVVGDFLLDLF
jgi:hypothetical protein